MIIYFVGHELEVKQIGKTTDESSYMIGRFNSDNSDVAIELFGQEIMNLRKRENEEILKVTDKRWENWVSLKIILINYTK